MAVDVHAVGVASGFDVDVDLNGGPRFTLARAAGGVDGQDFASIEGAVVDFDFVDDALKYFKWQLICPPSYSHISWGRVYDISR